MSRDVNTSVDVFINHFSARVQRLRDYELDPADRILKKNILASILDALSRTACKPQDLGRNRERFTLLVANFSDWPEGSRLSAPNISYLLERLRDPAFEYARAFICSIIESNSSGQLIPLTQDPDLQQMTNVWPVPPGQKLIGSKSLELFTHINLLYEHRNSIVHELREPGYGMEFSDDGTRPYYHGTTHVDSENNVERRTLELVYPLDFYFWLVESALANLAPYLKQNSLDPYDCFRFGSSWISELNE